MAKVILQRSTTIKAYLKFPKSAWSLWRKILSDHRVKAASYVEDLRKELEYLVLNDSESITSWQGRVEELCAKIEFHEGEAVTRRRIIDRILREATDVYKHLAWATDPRLVSLKAKFDNRAAVALEEVWNLLKTLELEYAGKHEPQNSASPRALSMQQEMSMTSFQSLLEKLERRLDAPQIPGMAQYVNPASMSTPIQRKKSKRTPPPGCPKGACYTYWESGICPNGASCKYTHEHPPTTGAARAATTETTGYAFSVRHFYPTDEIPVPSDVEIENHASETEDEDEPLPTNFLSLRYIDEAEDYDLHEWADSVAPIEEDYFQCIDDDRFNLNAWEDEALDYAAEQLTHPSPNLKRLYSSVKSYSVNDATLTTTLSWI